MSSLALTVLLAAWNSCGHATGAACGTVRSLAQAVGLDEGTITTAVRALQGAGYIEIDGFGVLALTAAGATAARRHMQSEANL